MADKPDDLTDAQIDRVYSALGDATEFWVVFGRGCFAFRSGPFTPAEAGAHMRTAIEKNIAITVIGQCGRDIDWQLADDLGCWLKGHPPRSEGGRCKVGDACVCGGDTPEVRSGCQNWIAD